MQQTLDRRQNRGDVVRRRPPVLKDVETEFAIGVHVRVEHAREELDRWWLVGVGFVEREQEFERAVFKRRVGCGIASDRAGGGVNWCIASEETGACLDRISRHSIS